MRKDAHAPSPPPPSPHNNPSNHSSDERYNRESPSYEREEGERGDKDLKKGRK